MQRVEYMKMVSLLEISIFLREGIHKEDTMTRVEKNKTSVVDL